jgi:nitroreductase
MIMAYSTETMISHLAATVTDAILSRRSCRAFSNRPVARETVQTLLETARYAPSGGNLQPWIVHVLSGESLARFRAMMAPMVAANPLGGEAQYAVYPPNLRDPYRSRRFKVGEDLYHQLGIQRADRAARIRQFAQNFDFFGAPVGLFFFVDRTMGPPQWSDVGMFMQNIMLLAREQGLHTCPQEAWSVWHREISAFLDVAPDLTLFCGMALGFGDGAAAVNAFRAERAPVEEFATWHT